MARTGTPEVDTPDELDTVVDESDSTEEKAPKVKKEPARGALPEGYVTPVGLANELSDKQDANGNFYHTAKDGSHKVPPQMVYSYMRNAPKDNPFPIETVQDSLGHDRQALKVADGLAWWTAKNARAAERKTNAAAKEAKKAEKASSTQAEDTEPQATEAE
jgi:hypothetical protein